MLVNGAKFYDLRNQLFSAINKLKHTPNFNGVITRVLSVKLRQVVLAPSINI